MTKPIPRGVAVVVRDGRVLVIKRYLLREFADECAMCAGTGAEGPQCPGHHYAVLPGGHVEDGERHEDAAVRELAEETTLRARAGELLRAGLHNGRPASYFLMADVTGEPVLSGPEAEEDCAENRFELLWAEPGDFEALGLYPADVREPLARLLRERR
ncbi:NUDIX domain-containing protein [Streptomyces sp. NRRL F-5123]|uniref:NUDIX domain-containing protein n=1 Tax=Streptomyces sp. NRRL F-5123 TaxID=1463856 RepID=UPI0004E25DA0|nr:NUDIX domain-containing protein [Streptomyces sp. NRRL F-5123]